MPCAVVEWLLEESDIAGWPFPACAGVAGVTLGSGLLNVLRLRINFGR